jgi:hypothetical protein
VVVSANTYGHITALIRGHWIDISLANSGCKSPPTEKSCLGNLDSFSESAHRKVHQAAVAFLRGVEKIHQQGYELACSEYKLVWPLVSRTSFEGTADRDSQLGIDGVGSSLRADSIDPYALASVDHG